MSCINSHTHKQPLIESEQYTNVTPSTVLNQVASRLPFSSYTPAVPLTANPNTKTLCTRRVKHKVYPMPEQSGMYPRWSHTIPPFTLKVMYQQGKTKYIQCLNKVVCTQEGVTPFHPLPSPQTQSGTYLWGGHQVHLQQACLQRSLSRTVVLESVQ